MIRAVLDLNIFISALFWKGLPFEVLKAGLEGRFSILTSPEILKELEGRLKNKFNFPDNDTADFLKVITINSFIVESDTRVKVVRDDPADDKIIECAVVGEAHFIVSGDHHLLDIGEYDKIKIVSAREFLSVL